MAELATWAVRTRKLWRVWNVHYWATLLLITALPAAFRAAGLPFRFTWVDYFRNYWFTLVGESIFGGTILYIAGVPFASSLRPFFRRYWKQKARFLITLPLAPILVLTLGTYSGLLIFLAAVVLFEVKDRAEANHANLSKMALDIFWPAAYMFVGMVLIFAYDDVIAAFRYNGAADLTLKHWDSVLLAGGSVSGLAHAVVGRWPGLVPWMDFIYFGMFAQIGGCLAIVALSEGRHRAMQFVGSILTAFYLALALFYLFPAAGPFGSCVGHFSMVPNGPMIYPIQRYILASLDRFRSGTSLKIIAEDYYIALPCMHLIEPVIVLWFLRRWKRMLVVLIAFDLFLVPCILLLEEHYVVDLLAALPVAALAIAISGRALAPSAPDTASGLLEPGLQTSPNRPCQMRALSTNGNGSEGAPNDRRRMWP